MLRNKPFLIGLGCGLIAGAVFLQLMISADQITKQNLDVPLTGLNQEQLSKEAERYDMKLVSKNDQVYSEQQIEEIKEKAFEEERQRVNSATHDVQDSPLQLVQETPSTQIIRAVLIPEPMDATAVANLLVQAEVITEPTELLSMLSNMNLTKKIRYGLYYFEDSTNVKKIAIKLTTLP